MPILPPEPNLYPDDLVQRLPAGDEDARWLVVYTMPRQEKSLARAALAREIPFYLPLVAKLNRIRTKVVRSHTPLFAGYLFTYVSEEQRTALLKTNHVSQMIEVDDQQRLTIELRHLETLIAADAPLTIERKLEAGRAVRVKSGPMAGTEGVVVSRKGKDRLLVAVTLLQQGVSVEIDDYQVEPIY